MHEKIRKKKQQMESETEREFRTLNQFFVQNIFTSFQNLFETAPRVVEDLKKEVKNVGEGKSIGEAE